jgi:hypothetical protein
MERPFATTGKMLLLLDYCNQPWVDRGGQEWGRESGETECRKVRDQLIPEPFMSLFIRAVLGVIVF